MRIRPYRAADKAAVIALWRSCGLIPPGHEPDADLVRNPKSSGKWLLVAEAASGLGTTKRLLGATAAGYDGNRGWIEALAVEPGVRRRGIGRALLAEAERRLGAAGCPRIDLRVTPADTGAAAFFASLGYATEPAVSLGKRIPLDPPWRPPSPHDVWRTLRPWLAPFAVVLVGLVLRVAHVDKGYAHPDETITVHVVRQMWNSGDWDTNWAKAPELESSFRYDQYNFSSYIYGSFLFRGAASWVPGVETFCSHVGDIWLFRLFSALAATVAVAQTWWLARRIGGVRAGLTAAALVAVAPLLVQDAHYIRPESFVTVLTLAAVNWSLPPAPGRRAGWTLFAAGTALGLAVASKVSMLALAWLPLAWTVLGLKFGRPGEFRQLAIATGCVTAGLGLGFAAGAPGAVANPGAFWHGVLRLAEQYAGLHPPHSRLDGGIVGPMLAGYFWSTLGAAAVIAGFAGATILIVRKRLREAVLLAAPIALFAVYFSTRTVFFERNLSHVVPLFCVLAAVALVATGERLARLFGGVKAAHATAGLLALVLFRPADLSSRLVWGEFSGRSAAASAERDAAIRAAHPGLEWRDDAFLNPAPATAIAAHFAGGGAPFLLREIDYHDEWSARYRTLLTDQFDVTLLATEPSVFGDVPGCTLHTYNSWTNRYYLVNGPLRAPLGK